MKILLCLSLIFIGILCEESASPQTAANENANQNGLSSGEAVIENANQNGLSAQETAIDNANQNGLSAQETANDNANQNGLSSEEAANENANQSDLSAQVAAIEDVIENELSDSCSEAIRLNTASMPTPDAACINLENLKFIISTVGCTPDDYDSLHAVLCEWNVAR